MPSKKALEKAMKYMKKKVSKPSQKIVVRRSSRHNKAITNALSNLNIKGGQKIIIRLKQIKQQQLVTKRFASKCGGNIGVAITMNESDIGPFLKRLNAARNELTKKEVPRLTMAPNLPTYAEATAQKQEILLEAKQELVKAEEKLEEADNPFEVKKAQQEIVKAEQNVENATEELTNLVIHLPPEEQKKVIMHLPPEEQKEVIMHLPPKEQKEVIMHLPENEQEEVKEVIMHLQKQHKQKRNVITVSQDVLGENCLYEFPKIIANRYRIVDTGYGLFRKAVDIRSDGKVMLRATPIMNDYNDVNSFCRFKPDANLEESRIRMYKTREIDNFIGGELMVAFKEEIHQTMRATRTSDGESAIIKMQFYVFANFDMTSDEWMTKSHSYDESLSFGNALDKLRDDLKNKWGKILNMSYPFALFLNAQGFVTRAMLITPLSINLFK